MMQKARKRIRWTDAYKLMDARDERGIVKPFDIKFVTRDGRVDVAEQVQQVTSYNRLTGMRRMRLKNGGWRNVYDSLILQINDTKIIVS